MKIKSKQDRRREENIQLLTVLTTEGGFDKVSVEIAGSSVSATAVIAQIVFLRQKLRVLETALAFNQTPDLQPKDDPITIV